jgi:hypothetical protein
MAVKAKEETIQELSQETVSPVAPEMEVLLNRLALLEKQLAQGTPKVGEQPREIVNVVDTKLEKPRRILFTINAIQDDDAIHDGAYIPGKAVVSKFKFMDYVRCNETGTKYQTGFEYDELDTSTDLEGEELAQYIKDVRIARKWAERMKGTSLDSENDEFWKRQVFRLDSLEGTYDTNQVDHLILYYNILGGSYVTIAKSYEEAKAEGLRLYMSVKEIEDARKHEGRKAYNQAVAALVEVENKWSRKDALYLMYYLPPVNKYKGYTVNTPIGTIINELADYIDGVDTKTEKKKRPQKFLDAIKSFETNKQIVQANALFKAAEYYGFINYYKNDKLYRNRTTGFEYGNTVHSAVDQLLHPKGTEELAWLLAKVNEKWIN